VNCNSPTADRIFSADEARHIAETLVRDRFSEAKCAFAAGSIFRGEGTFLSDIDLVVIHSNVQNAYRESLTVDGCPIEVFVHDPDTLRYFLHKDREEAHTAMAAMVSEGIVLPNKTPFSEALREEARSLLNAGPPPLEPETIERMRYEITDAVDDLRGKRPLAEMVGCGVALYGRLGSFILRTRSGWNASGKWLPRLIACHDPQLAIRFDQAFRNLFRDGKADAVISLAEDVLRPHGGFLFAGYTSNADPSWRRKKGQSTAAEERAGPHREA
jgi:hypothetical protein